MNYSNEPHGVFFLIDNKSFYASIESVEFGLNPLKSCLVVLSEEKNSGSGLILASSPKAKELFSLHNVSRKRDLPQNKNLIVVPPRMNLYIKRNLQINNIFNHYTTKNNCYPYSIDETILDMTNSWSLHRSKPSTVARKIQKEIQHNLGLYTTIGIGENPLQAKLALDLFAKHDQKFIANLNYQNFTNKIWPISDITKIWSIGKATAANLAKLDIHTIYELAHTNPYFLKKN